MFMDFVPEGQGHNGNLHVKFCRIYKAFAKSARELKARSISG
jgi:hypothetical protein